MHIPRVMKRNVLYSNMYVPKNRNWRNVMNLPLVFEEKMRNLLKEEFDAYIACYEEPRYYGLRVNTRKLSAAEFEKICPFAVRGSIMGFIMTGKLYRLQSIPIILPGFTTCRSQVP